MGLDVELLRENSSWKPTRDISWYYVTSSGTRDFVSIRGRSAMLAANFVLRFDLDLLEHDCQLCVHSFYAQSETQCISETTHSILPGFRMAHGDSQLSSRTLDDIMGRLYVDFLSLFRIAPNRVRQVGKSGCVEGLFVIGWGCSPSWSFRCVSNL